jgi:hypothetical protein|tara:strand:+ start:1760 stop:2734 length:975 start_codon:yes stop_codon:yes gene_type:complete
MNLKKTAICILSYNTESYISKVLKELVDLERPLLIIDDCSTDSSYSMVDSFIKDNPSHEILLFKNQKNQGAGYSCRKLIKEANNLGYKYIVKVDGDDQFNVSDIKKIIIELETEKYDFIKSNRFWDGGITGDIPKIRYFGNIIATQFLHYATGLSKIYDPLNGLFAVSTDIHKSLNVKNYPKRYGYPFFITCEAILKEYRSLQINNQISYESQQSSIRPYRLLFNLIRQTFFFNRKKFKLKKNNYRLHKSLFYELVFRILVFCDILLMARFILGYFTEIPIFQTNIAGWGILLVIFTSLTVYIYSLSFNLENNYRKEMMLIDEG